MADETQTTEEGQVAGGEGTEETSSTETTTTSTTTTPEYSDVEKQAMAQGWVPKEQYEGTGKWRSAEEFLDRGELFSKIDEQNRKLRATEATLEALKKHHKKVAETEYKRAVEALKAEKKLALDSGDSNRVVEIDDEIAAARTEAAKAIQEIDQQQAAPELPNPHFVVWLNRNQWYQTDRAMKAYADTVGDELAGRGMRNPTEILAEVERRVKKEFSHKFTNPNRAKAGAVEGGGSKGSTSTDSFQLTPEETQVMNKFVKAGVMTKAEYIAEIKASRS